jgi:hypothetical protein
MRLLSISVILRRDVSRARRPDRVGHHQHRLLLKIDRGLDYSANVALIQYVRKRLDGLGVGYLIDDPAFAQGRLVEEPERAVGDLER